jgi:hypothetical protein
VDSWLVVPAAEGITPAKNRSAAPVTNNRLLIINGPTALSMASSEL